jgi:hypothetical protein
VKVSRIEVILLVTERPASVELPANATSSSSMTHLSSDSAG